MTHHQAAASFFAALSVALLASCGVIQPLPEPAVPHLWRPSCSAALGRAHAALATVGEDPAAAHAAHAVAMHEYHACLATEAR